MKVLILLNLNLSEIWLGVSYYAFPLVSSRLSCLSQVSHLFLNHPKIKILTTYCQDMTIWVTCDHFGDLPSPIHDIKDDHVFQVSGQEPLISSKYPYKGPPILDTLLIKISTQNFQGIFLEVK